MELVAVIPLLLLWGLVVGALARFAVPGPDPMRIWVTILVGVAGSAIAGLVANYVLALTGDVILVLALPVLCAALVIVAHRRFVQHRPVTGPNARAALRGRRKPAEPKAPEQASRPQLQGEEAAEHLRKLGRLRDAGVITPDEFEAKKADLLGPV